MTTNAHAASPSVGTLGHRNWRACADSLPHRGSFEIALYGDCHLTEAEIGFGPYTVFNTMAVGSNHSLRMPAVALVDWHLPAPQLPDMTRGDTSAFHGGDLGDEIAALISLVLGVRLQSGGVVREFEPDDPRGRPVQHGHQLPSLPVPLSRLPIPPQPVISGLHVAKPLAALAEPLSRFSDIEPDKAVEVVRAARSYQQGVWMSDSDPEYAWLKLVSALETAANCWFRGDLDAETALRSSKPELARCLDDNGAGHVVEAVAHILRDQLRAMHKFFSFVERYSPEPLLERPPDGVQVDWAVLSESMKTIYGYRSKSLHAGVPFPPPLLRPPHIQLDWSAPSERPLGLAHAEAEGRWMADELPMHLHVFEHVTRRALLTWLTDPEQGPAPCETRGERAPS